MRVKVIARAQVKEKRDRSGQERRLVAGRSGAWAGLGLHGSAEGKHILEESLPEIATVEGGSGMVEGK